MTLICVISIVSMDILRSFAQMNSSFYIYLDATIEHEMPMTAASMFWRETLHGCKIEQSLPLPYDRYRRSDEYRTGRGTTVSFDFSEDLSHDFITYSSSTGISLEQLLLASYYVFLFKLTAGETDLFIGMNTNGRYKEDLMFLIGIFVNTIPLRCQLDPNLSFHQLSEHVKDIMTSSLEYSYYPLLRILAQHGDTKKPAFLEISYDFQRQTSTSCKNEVMIGDTCVCPMPFSFKMGRDELLSKFDFVLSIQQDLDFNRISCTIDASLDVFDRKTVDKMGQQFHLMLEQLFITNYEKIKKPIYELSLVLPYEKLIMKSMNNTEVLFAPATSIHDQFVYQVIKHPQKVALEMDDQFLTYSEFLYHSQVLSLNLLNDQRVVVGDIICQCVERSLSMVS